MLDFPVSLKLHYDQCFFNQRSGLKGSKRPTPPADKTSPITIHFSGVRIIKIDNRQFYLLHDVWTSLEHDPAAETETRLSFFRILNLYCKVQFLGAV